MIPQWVAITISVLLFVAAGFTFWFFLSYKDYDSMWLSVGVPSAALLIALGSLVWSLDDNYYDVQSGTVVDQSFTAAHCDPGYFSTVGNVQVWNAGTCYNDDWAIKLQDTHGQTGWIHFSSDPSTDYPNGSQYPHI